ncbi:MAG: hypothetical protein ACYCWA_03155 [Thiobacillus sp.]
MERLDSPKNRLAEHGSFAEARKTVREKLAKGAGKTGEVYEVVLPSQKLAVFGIAMNGEWLKKIDMQDHVAGLPCEICIVDNEVGSSHGRFRIALASRCRHGAVHAHFLLADRHTRDHGCGREFREEVEWSVLAVGAPRPDRA